MLELRQDINQIIDAGMVTSYKMTLPKGVTYFFSITAYDNSGTREQSINRSEQKHFLSHQ